MTRWGMRAGRVFDGDRFVELPTLLVEQDSIVAVGESLPESIDVVDLGEATVLPGLVDCHQHLVFDGRGTLEEQVAGRSDAELADRARRNARRALRGGVTALRDLGDRSFLTLELRDDPDLARVMGAGPPITPPGGHCYYLGGETAGGPELLRAVRERAERGADLVKLMVTGGAGTPTHPLWDLQYTPDEIRSVVDEAHRLGLPVAAHCHGVVGIEAAADAGVDSIEHCSFFDAEMRSVPPPELLSRLAERGIAISATLGYTSPPPYPPVWMAAVPIMRSAFADIHREGGVVVVGTDAGINLGKPHDVLPYAHQILLDDVGMAPVEALRAMTSVAADVCGRPELGRLRAGSPADLVAVADDPSVSSTALIEPIAVWKDGRAVRDDR